MSGKNGAIRKLHEMCRSELRVRETEQNRKVTRNVQVGTEGTRNRTEQNRKAMVEKIK
jgi:hypothetical protein